MPCCLLWYARCIVCHSPPVLWCDGGTVLLLVWRERFDWGGFIRLDCPGLIGPLDTAALARRPIKPFRLGKVRFFWRERLDSMILEHKSFAYGQCLRNFSTVTTNPVVSEKI